MTLRHKNNESCIGLVFPTKMVAPLAMHVAISIKDFHKKQKQVHYYFVSKSGHAYGLHVSAFELSRCMKWTENTIEHGP